MTQNTEHINELIVSLCDYAEERGLITRDDRVFAANAICEDMHVSSFSDIPVQPAGAEAPEVRLERILIALCDKASALCKKLAAAYHLSSSLSLGIQGVIAAIAISIILSSGSRVVIRCIARPGAESILVNVLSLFPARRMHS